MGIVAYGSSLAEVFEACALGMMSLILDPHAVEGRQEVPISAEAGDAKALLVAWLSEVLFLVEAEGWAFGDFRVGEIAHSLVRGRGVGEPLDARKHGLHGEVKAATYHMLELAEEDGLWKARVIFDV